MIGIDIETFKDIEDDIDFAKKLLNEKFVLVFPCQAFFARNLMRIILCTTTDILDEFAKRLREFCEEHKK